MISASRLGGEGRPEADPVGEEDFFEGTGLVGFVSGGGDLFPGVPGLGIPDPEGQGVAVPVNEFVGFRGSGDGVNVVELELLYLLHVVSFRSAIL